LACNSLEEMRWLVIASVACLAPAQSDGARAWLKQPPHMHADRACLLLDCAQPALLESERLVAKAVNDSDSLAAI
jgi:hypothetical protein